MAFEAPAPEALPDALHATAGASRPAHGLISVALILVSVAFATAGQFTLKAAMNRVTEGSPSSSSVDTLTNAAKEPRLWAGLALFGISAVFWLVVLAKVPLSFAYPFVGLSYIVIVLVARLVLHEHVPTLRWVGVAVVAMGIAIVGLSFRRMSGTG
jgi:multidrug transporter EmrE-like cation transporter